MAQIIPFSAATSREMRTAPATNGGELVAMRHIDLDTVLSTVAFLREIGRGHLLDGFNRGPSPATASRQVKHPGRGKRRLPT